MNENGQGRVSISLAASTAYLKLMADNGWTTKRALSLWLKNSNGRSRVIKNLEKDKYIRSLRINERVQAKKRQYRTAKKEDDTTVPEYLASLPESVHGVRYILLPKGREFLASLNPVRYGSEGAGAGQAPAPIVSNEVQIYRQSLLSETRAMGELAGFSVHPHQKPDITKLSFLNFEQPVRAALSALSVDPKKYVGAENAINNQQVFQYYEKNIFPKFYTEPKDIKRYIFHETPIGCIYTSQEIKQLAKMEAVKSGGNGEEVDKLMFSRFSGIFFSGNGPYILYNTEQTALRLRQSGEQSVRIYTDSWAANIYKRSLSLIRDDGYGNQIEEELPAKTRGAILFGDDTFRAAIRVVESSLISGAQIFHRKATDAMQETQFLNTVTVPDIFYLPVCKQAIDLFALMLFPHWQVYVKDLTLNYHEKLSARGEMPKLVRDLIGEDENTGLLEDGSYLITMISLHLDVLKQLLSEMPFSREQYTFAFMEWQKPFFEKLLEGLSVEIRERIKLMVLPSRELEEYVHAQYMNNGLIPYWEL